MSQLLRKSAGLDEQCKVCGGHVNIWSATSTAYCGRCGSYRVQIGHNMSYSSREAHWTDDNKCSNCGVKGSKAYSYCCRCGRGMTPEVRLSTNREYLKTIKEARAI